MVDKYLANDISNRNTFARILPSQPKVVVLAHFMPLPTRNWRSPEGSRVVPQFTTPLSETRTLYNLPRYRKSMRILTRISQKEMKVAEKILGGCWQATRKRVFPD